MPQPTWMLGWPRRAFLDTHIVLGGVLPLYSPVLLVPGSGAHPAAVWPREHPPLTTPLRSLQFIVISSLLEQPPLTLFDYQYPEWSISVGSLIGASSFVCIPVYMVYKLVWTPGSLKQRLAVCIRPEKTTRGPQAEAVCMSPAP
ncbi:sodium-dependent serotonin transporter-like [Athene cunicularia]|uniref:sodium-dependent serotonin transporter-like n=1 Tax=Athene cunicularia TaxID=194338 RepID=UPI000EF6E851|nr:sodium-dependent serotonin transporter-like [Athene cunicularia]